MVSNRRAGREFMSVEAGEVPLAPAAYEEARGNYVVALAEQGRLLTFDITEMRQMARGRGVIVMGLEKDEKLVAVGVTNEKELTVEGVGRGGKEKQVRLAGEKLAHYHGHRARMGRVLPDKLKPRALTLPAKPEPPPAGR
jgi:topoisomerase-4 subunit A